MRKNDDSLVPFGARKLLLGVVATGAFLVGYALLDAPPQAAAAPAAKVQVCHIPPGNPDNFHTITISEKALAAHLAHGDSAGACNDLCDAICNDDDRCTIDDLGDCEENGCPAYPRVPVDCGASDQCYEPICDSVQGCVNTIPDGTMCDDGEVCTEFDTCGETGCAGIDFGDECCLNTEACMPTNCNPAFCGTDHRCHDDLVVCDEPGLCQSGACSEIDGECVYADIECPASENACVVNECNEATNPDCGEVALNCDDEDVCTNDSCDPVSGCANTGIQCAPGDTCRPLTGCDPLEGCEYGDLGPNCCLGDNDCQQDANLCTRNRCLGNQCVPTDLNHCPPDHTCVPSDGSCEPDAPAPCFDANDCLGSDLQCLLDSCEALADCPDEGRRPFDHFGAVINSTGNSCVSRQDPAACDSINQDLIREGCLNVCETLPPPNPTGTSCECRDVLGQVLFTFCFTDPAVCPNVTNCQNTCSQFGLPNSTAQCLPGGC